MMQAVEITQPGGPEVLALTERPMPEPAHDQVVIKVAYAGVNRPDALQRAGLYNPPAGASDLPNQDRIAQVGGGFEVPASVGNRFKQRQRTASDRYRARSSDFANDIDRAAIGRTHSRSSSAARPHIHGEFQANTLRGRLVLIKLRQSIIELGRGHAGNR